MPPPILTPVILAIDQGTTNTKALLINQQGEPIFRTTRPVPILTTSSGRIEQDPEALWQSVVETIADCLHHMRQHNSTIAAIALTNQRETSIAWRRSTGQPFANAVGWQCQRSAEIAARLTPHAETIRRISGLPLNPVLSATKFTWLLENIPAVYQAAQSNDLCLGTVDSWLLYKLTSGAVHATDHTNASRTALLDLETLTWSPELLDLFDLPATALPELHPSATNFGPANAIPELATIPITSAIGDSHAALAGHGNFHPGIVKATYGTGSSLMMLTPTLPPDTPNLARTVAWSTDAGLVEVEKNCHPDPERSEGEGPASAFLSSPPQNCHPDPEPVEGGEAAQSKDLRLVPPQKSVILSEVEGPAQPLTSPRPLEPFSYKSSPHQTAYALEGNIFMTGSALQWLGEFLNLPNPSTDLIALAEQAPDSANLHFIPAMAGLGAPHWDASARGQISGLERTHTLAHLARAALESIAFQVADVFFAMQATATAERNSPTKAGVPHSSQPHRELGSPPALRVGQDEWETKTPTSLQADGGATRSDALMQFQADILGIPVHRSTNEELSAIGAAYLAGLTLSKIDPAWWPNLEAIAQLPRQTQTFHPRLSEEARTHRYAAWQQALSRACTSSGIIAREVSL